MSKSALLHGIRPGEPGWVDRLIAFHRNAFGDTLMVEGEGSTGGAAAGAAGGEAGAAGGAGGSGEGTGASAGTGTTETGFPPNTPWRDMTAQQQVAYWQHQARKHEQRASERGDYDELKRKAEQFDQAQRAAMTEHEKAIEQAREAAKAEGRTEALTEANRKAVNALIDGALRLRGKSAEDVQRLTVHLNADSFVKDGAPDTEAILTLVNDLAGPVTGGGTRGPDHGMGHRGAGSQATGVSAGAELFAASRSKQQQTTTTP